MKIAIIDDGINQNYFAQRIYQKVDFSSGVSQNGEDSRHGTICAQIIRQICGKIDIVDVKVLKNGTAHIRQFIKALKWCECNDIKLVHLSIGTVNYFDIKPLENQIKKMLKKGIIIVAAYHNKNIKTFPASFPGVFGVRQDRESILSDNDFLFQNSAELNKENCIVVHGKKSEDYGSVNSFAAPVISGYIAKYLVEYANADFYMVLDHLVSISNKEKRYTEEISTVVKKNSELLIPVIQLRGMNNKNMTEFVSIFDNEGYSFILLEEGISTSNSIPFGYFRKDAKKIEDILYTIDMIYKPDTIFISSRKNLVSNEIDLIISSVGNCYEIITHEGYYSVSDLEKMYQAVYKILN